MAGQSNEWLCEGKARHRSAKICVAKQRHCKDPLGVTRHSKGIAWQGDGQQRKGIDKLSVARARQGKEGHGIAGHSMAVFGKGRALVAVEPFGYEERTYSECCVR